MQLTASDIDQVPTEAECRRLIGEVWNLKVELEEKHRALRLRREYLWRKENKDIIEGASIPTASMAQLMSNPDFVHDLRRLLAKAEAEANKNGNT